MISNPSYVMMNAYNGNNIYEGLSKKIKKGQQLTNVDMLNLIFLPLMNNTIPRNELATDSIKLAQTISDETKRNACIAAAFAFANRYLDANEIDELLEVLKMTDLATMLATTLIDEKMEEVAKEMLKGNEPVEKIIRYFGLDESTIKRLQTELDNE